MHPVLLKTFGGLTKAYYFRQFFFGLLFAAFFVFMTMQSKVNNTHPGQYVFLVLSTLLYPYSRFVYESIVDFFLGKNIFFVNAIVMLFTKLITMLICFCFAIFIAPIGLAYLYYHHSKQA